MEIKGRNFASYGFRGQFIDLLVSLVWCPKKAAHIRLLQYVPLASNTSRSMTEILAYGDLPTHSDRSSRFPSCQTQRPSGWNRIDRHHVLASKIATTQPPRPPQKHKWRRHIGTCGISILTILRSFHQTNSSHQSNRTVNPESNKEDTLTFINMYLFIHADH